jgi:hypothetical protein
MDGVGLLGALMAPEKPDGTELLPADFKGLDEIDSGHFVQHRRDVAVIAGQKAHLDLERLPLEYALVIGVRQDREEQKARQRAAGNPRLVCEYAGMD